MFHCSCINFLFVNICKNVFRIEGHKDIVFYPRLTAFHYTLAPAGGWSEDRPIISGIWHEGECGRKANELTSVLLLMLRSPLMKTKSDITLWFDNAVSQNKNYTMMSMGQALVNMPMHYFRAETLTYKFFEVGHSFMAADSFHAAVEKKIKKKRNVFTIEEFGQVVASAAANVTIVRPQVADIFDLRGYDASRAEKPRPLLADLSVIQFRRGHPAPFVKTMFDGVWIEFDFQTQQVMGGDARLDRLAPLRQSVRGVAPSVHADLMRVVVPIIERLEGGEFSYMADVYRELPINQAVANLRTHDDPDPADSDQ